MDSAKNSFKLIGITAATPTSISAEAHQALLKAALELGQTYAKLAPSRELGTVLAGDADYGFLDMLWRAQQPGGAGNLSIKEQLDKGVKALGRSLNGVTDPITTLKFLNNLLNAAANSVALNEPRLANSGGGFDPRGDIRSAQFIRELVAFGFEVAKVNPTVTTTGETVISEFLNTLWKGGDDRKGQGGLNQFFEGAKSGSDRVKLLEFGDRLVDAAQLLQGADLPSQKKDARFLSQLLNLGEAYAALKPVEETEDSKLFLNTLWREQNLQKGANEFGQFISNDADNLNELFNIERKALRQYKLSLDKGVTSNPTLISKVLDIFKTQLIVPSESPSDFLSSLARNALQDKSLDNELRKLIGKQRDRDLNQAEVNYAAEIFADSVDFSKVGIAKDKWVDYAVVTLGNVIYFPSKLGGTDMFQPGTLELTAAGRIVLIHELTHVWQYQNSGWRYVSGSVLEQLTAQFLKGDAYDWTTAYENKLPWEQWGVEQQAAAVEEYNASIRRVTFQRKRREKVEDKDIRTVTILRPYIEKLRRKEGAPEPAFPKG
ncbi:hypothetical protein C7B65_26280 [Phormidesmis priestleyi ULC007]|uniref:DUF4157 domain-containing protein n=1 Tax=Phormidesmis priestleyi ULC007 TaxID=1920490 RepID=A0A2T1D244_9CYAN|nr:hypothetical protein [Phormidesmis priestleyi]PSB14558.1 hypothetical protein C7B65_26280 [Phormidesmis priestleyi ULC007]PZO50031.1 MAG: hypothetical protein DCF14_12905 [Phormidesmis priestleyi]